MEQRLEILFKEYDTLRAEIISRINNIFQIVGFAVSVSAVGMPLLWSRTTTYVFWISVLALAAVLYGLWLLVHVEIGRAAERLRQIEAQVNGIEGQELLQWETRWGRAGSWITYLIKSLRSK
ncbi:MAG: hypothetical protein WBE37_32950 [Bryobacteraceae bacterium]